MSRPTALACVFIVCLITTFAAAAEQPQRIGHGKAARSSGPAAMAKSEVDTFYLLGGPGRYDGRFETQSGAPDWQGWSHADATAPSGPRWQISEFQALAGAYSMWCGAVFASGDPGYGNSWRESLVFRHAVPNTTVATTVAWTGRLRVDVEPIYDFVYLQVNRGGQWETLHAFDGEALYDLDETVVIEPGEYAGPDQDEIQLRLRLESDHVWSDEDQNWDTDGACQFDDVAVAVGGVPVDFEDFEDQVSDRWLPDPTLAVGDFAKIWPMLFEEDPCFSNYSPQVAFIDDGYVVPGTGGTQCITWCYGPGGYIVNNSGGLAGDGYHLEDYAVSPVLEWPATADAAYLKFEVYRHESLAVGSAGIFYAWNVRSIDTGDPADLADARWRNRNLVGYGGPGYVSEREDLTNLLEPGVTHLQVALRVMEWGYIWGDIWDGDDGTPAPYFDNVQVVAYAAAGPSITARSLDLFNDGFPASGELDAIDLAANAVRLDMARNVSPPDHLRNDPGDSVVFDAATIRAGAFLLGPPRLHVRMSANPLFRDVRAMPDNFTLVPDALADHDLVTGWVDADSVFAPGGGYVQNRWSCDLPDDGFFFPGDVIHYYIVANDNAAGDIGTSLLPADTSGFAAFAGLSAPDRYDYQFSVRALPSVRRIDSWRQPRTLLWDDHGDADAQDDWRDMFARLYRVEGQQYDLFATQSPSSGVGNGLGGRATLAQIETYEVILYTGGDLSSFLLGDGDFQRDPSDDIGLLSSWLALGEKHMLLTGDNVASELEFESAAGAQFLAEHVGLNVSDRNLRPYIGDQTAPLARILPGNDVIGRVDSWITYGGCPSINRFDAVTVQGGTARLAEFTDPAGNAGVYDYAAATLNHNEITDAEVVLLPYDLTFVYTAPGWFPPPGYGDAPARAVMLEDILFYFGDYDPPPPPGVAPDAVFQVRQYPNPFNPTTTVALDLPRASEVSLKIYDLRGALTRTLLDERLAAGHHELPWNGTDDRGAAVASGVYFCETRAGGEVRIHKMALVK